MLFLEILKLLKRNNSIPFCKLEIKLTKLSRDTTQIRTMFYLLSAQVHSNQKHQRFDCETIRIKRHSSTMLPGESPYLGILVRSALQSYRLAY